MLSTRVVDEQLVHYQRNSQAQDLKVPRIGHFLLFSIAGTIPS
jgi:hypothetical protein